MNQYFFSIYPLSGGVTHIRRALEYASSIPSAWIPAPAILRVAAVTAD